MSSVKVESKFSEPLTSTRGFRQHYGSFFNIIMENAKVNKTRTINIKSLLLLAYADDIYIVERTERGVTGAISKIERESAIGLTVNEDKTIILLTTARKTQEEKGEIVTGKL